MYCRKSVAPIIDSWGTPALTGYSCENFPSRISDLKFQTLSKALDISSATVGVAPDLLKALAILSDTTIRRSAID